MTLPNAMRFIHRVRDETALREKIKALGPAAEMASLIQIGSEAGLEFTDAELQLAFRQDWGLRWLAYINSKKAA